ncbi:hypothetical protein YC2023_103964 [Brassica napus]
MSLFDSDHKHGLCTVYREGEAIYPLLKDVALSLDMPGGSNAMKQMFTFALRSARKGIVTGNHVLAEEATSIAILHRSQLIMSNMIHTRIDVSSTQDFLIAGSIKIFEVLDQTYLTISVVAQKNIANENKSRSLAKTLL